MKTPPTFLSLSLATLILITAGCSLSKKQGLNREYFLLNVVNFSNTTFDPLKAVHPGVVMVIKPLGMATAFDKKEFVYRTGEYSYETDYYRAFQVIPSTLMTEQTFEWLSKSGLFGQVTRSGSLVHPNYALQGFVNEFYGDYSPGKSASAVLSITYKVIGRSDKVFDQLLMEKTYVQRVPLDDREVYTLVKAWNGCLRNILVQLAHDLRGLDYITGEPLSKNQMPLSPHSGKVEPHQ